MKKFLKFISVICAVIILGAGCYYLYRITLAPKKFSYYISEPSYNAGNTRAVVGIYSYVFVGFIEETHDYMSERFKREFPETIKEFDLPMTECNVKVIKNIKGSLRENVTFPVYKTGGLSKNLMYIEREQNSIMPEAEKYYIFFGYAHEDGTLTVGDHPGIVEIESGINAENLESSKLYQEYVDAYENQILPKYSIGYSYLEKNDVNFGNGEYNQKLYQKELKEEAEKAKKEKASLNAE